LALALIQRAAAYCCFAEKDCDSSEWTLAAVVVDPEADPHQHGSDIRRPGSHRSNTGNPGRWL